ncbi:hypothetical protein ACSTS3_21670 [Aquimarina muelleri]|uniref:hypothetical protein n=1 Tax=Aquimarina muelleri TaxID=279356 RepID=UPI003F684008
MDNQKYPSKVLISIYFSRSSAGMISTFATGELTWALSGALSSLFMVADVIATQEVNKIMNDVRDYNKLLLENAKRQGLSKLRLFLDTTRTEGLIGFDVIGNISLKTHCKIMNGKIKTIKDFRKSLKEDKDDSGVSYSYLIQQIENKETERDTIIIDSVYMQ